jgi:hypothetical protein
MAQLAEIRVADTGCGSGGFLIKVLRSFWQQYQRVDRAGAWVDKILKPANGELYLAELPPNVEAAVAFRRRQNFDNRRVLIAQILLRHIFGVCDRNAECWLAADPGQLAAHVGGNAADFTGADPSPAVKRAFGLVGFDKTQHEPQVAHYVKSGPIDRWLNNRSFAHFYDQVRQRSKEIQCPNMENLRSM